jgi:hypothetical protein
MEPEHPQVSTQAGQKFALDNCCEDIERFRGVIDLEILS